MEGGREGGRGSLPEVFPIQPSGSPAELKAGACMKESVGKVRGSVILPAIHFWT